VVFGPGNGFDISGLARSADTARTNIFINGQLMLTGSGKDYTLDISGGSSDADIKMTFVLVEDDVVTVNVI